MAECRSDVAMAPPGGPHSPSFSTLLGQGHTPKLKSYILSRLSKEQRHGQPAPLSPSSPPAVAKSKPMPALELLRDSAEPPRPPSHGASCPLPKKRPRLSHEDPTLLDAAVSSPFCLPDTPFSARGDGGEASPTPPDVYSAARLTRHPPPPLSTPTAPAHDLDLASVFPLSPPSYTMNNIFDLPFSPTATITPSPKGLSQPPSPACKVPPLSMGVPTSPLAEVKKEDEWLTHGGGGALDLSQLPHLVLASPFRDTSCSPRSPPGTQLLGQRPEMPTTGPIQLGGPQSCFHAVSQQRTGFQQIVGPHKLRYQSGGAPSRGPYPMVRPVRAVYPPSAGPGYVPGLVPHAFDLARHRQRPYQPKPAHVYPPPLKPIPGAGSRQIPADMTPNRAYPRDMQEPPSATHKQLPWLPCDIRHENQPSIAPPRTFEKNNYQGKPIAEWNYRDVIKYIFEAYDELELGDNPPDINFYELSSTTGEDLLKMGVDGFRKFSKDHGEKFYRHFIKRRDDEKMLELQRHEEMQRREEMRRQEELRHEERRQSLVSSQQMFSPQSFEYLSSPNNLSQAPHLQPTIQRDQGHIMVETSAPYEVRYEAAHRPMGMENGLRSGISDAFPTASLKTFPLFSATSPTHHYNAVTECLSDPDHSAAEEEEPKPEQPKKRGPGRPRKPENELKKKKKKTGRLWEFIRNLLLDPETCPSMVKWENPEEGIFRFVQAEKVAQRWGERKQNKDMNYEKLSRAMRYYYKGGVFEAVLGRRLVYKFGKNAKNWRPSNPNFTNPPM